MEKNSNIHYFCKAFFLGSLQEKSTLFQRRKIYEVIKKQIDVKGQHILDYGASSESNREDSNCFLKWFLEDGANVSVYSIENINFLKEKYPQIQIIAANRLKGMENQFDIVFSSAVIEHVGSGKQQEEFVRTLARLSRNWVCLTTPNRWHYFEFHTLLPFLHWFPKKWHRFFLKTLGWKDYSQENHLNLLSYRDLKLICAPYKKSTEILGFWFLGAISNWCVIFRKNQK